MDAKAGGAHASPVFCVLGMFDSLGVKIPLPT
jgi:hypothetical protein